MRTTICGKPRHIPFVLILALGWAACTSSEEPSADSPSSQELLEVEGGFIYEDAPFPSAHASTVVESPDGLAAAWFGGTDEGEPDVAIWFSRKTNGSWTAPIQLANGVQSDELRYPCWNPVLFHPENGPLVLFYKVGPSPREWWGMAMLSEDQGETWSDAFRLPEGILGPIRAKPVMMPDGSLLAGSSTEHEGWVVHMERLTVPEEGTGIWTREWLSSPAAWKKVGPLNDPNRFEAIQPTILRHGSGSIQILCRSRQNVITEAWSEDGGETWSDMQATELPNPSAGIDALRLTDGRFLMVYNPTTRGRHQLGLALSDDGHSWEPVGLLEDTEGEFSYPAMIQTSDGDIHVTYTWKRERIKHVIVNPVELPG